LQEDENTDDIARVETLNQTMQMVVPPPSTHNPHLPPPPPSPSPASSVPPSSPHQSQLQYSSPPRGSPHRSPTPTKHKYVKQYNEADVQWHQMVAGYYRMILDSPPEFGCKLCERYHGWEGENGFIAKATNNEFSGHPIIWDYIDRPTTT
jgi:hypothetical protein